MTFTLFPIQRTGKKVKDKHFHCPLNGSSFTVLSLERNATDLSEMNELKHRNATVDDALLLCYDVVN